MEKSRQENSVLERIKKKALALKETTLVEYRGVENILKEGGHILKGPRPEKEQRPKSGPGRPRLAREDRSQSIRITLPPSLFKILEERKKKTSSRSKALCALLEKGMAHERLRRHHAQELRALLKEFASLFSAIKIGQSHKRRKNSIAYGGNEVSLAKLYRKSLEIKCYLDTALIDPITFKEVQEFLTPKEFRYLSFASMPESMARVVDDEGPRT